MPDTPQAPSRENVFTRKIGPLPMWLWVVIVAVPLLVYSLYKQKKAATTASTTGTGTSSTTSASQVPQFVNQTYTTVIPPAAPTAAATPGPAGPAGDATHIHNHEIHPPLPPGPAQRVQGPPAGSPPGAPGGSSAGGPSSQVGNTLSQAISAIQASGWQVNSILLQGITGVRNSQGINPTNAAQYGTYKVVGWTPHTQGLTGQYFNNSVDIVIA
jgi:hypothetical protein